MAEPVDVPGGDLPGTSTEKMGFWLSLYAWEVYVVGLVVGHQPPTDLDVAVHVAPAAAA